VAFVVLLAHHGCAEREEVPSWHPRRFGQGKGDKAEGASAVRAAARTAHHTGRESSGYTAGDGHVATWVGVGPR